MLCMQVEDLLRGAGVRYRPIEIVDREEQDMLISRFDARSFPVVLVDGKYLGGFTHVVQLHSESRLHLLGSAPDPDAAPGSQKTPTPPRAESQRRIDTLNELAKLGEYLHKPKLGQNR